MNAALVVAGLWLGAAEPGHLRTLVPGTQDTAPVCLQWSKRTITYTVDEVGSTQVEGDAEFDAINAAFAAWQKVSDTCSDFRFQAGPRQSQPRVGQGTEASNAIVFREAACRQVAPQDHACWSDGSCPNLFRCWDESDLTIALTTTTYSKRTGVIYDADIELNGAPHVDGTRFLFTTVNSPQCRSGFEAPTCVATDVQNTLTHEIGHMLGFDHVDIPGSTMEPSAQVGDLAKRVIDRGTADGLCLTYPRGEPPQPCDQRAQLSQTITIVANGASGCGCQSAPVWPAVMLLTLRAFRRRSFRRC